ncbi:MAG TPA: alpha-L-fucosidase [Gemmatimonadaceae bacterium]|nr:alpha-L-fucosidase [Gemmatimonadaceae bacterium]
MTHPTRRGFLAMSATAAVARGLLGGLPTGLVGPLVRQGGRPAPTPSQLLWQRDELALFLHFGVNTFTDREWGDGRESPAIFAPARLDARQWARVARECGFRAMVLTAKHHDGFCLWPSRTTTHSVASSPWREGRGDVVREFVDACRAEQLRVGLYCSPWDRHEPSYGDSPRYNDLYAAQLTELLTQYGPVHEVWFDGANGEGPNGRRQEYDWPRVWGLVRRLQPDAVIFSDAGPDVRWIGNERGVAGETNWSTVDPAVVPVPGMTGDAVMRMLQEGDPAGSVWRPGETDVSIRPGWFYHPAEDARVRSVDNLVELFFTSVGRNSKLLLNVPPTREGLLHEVDVARLRGMHEHLSALFARDFAAEGNATFTRTGERSTVTELTLPRVVSVTIADLREDITRGQGVASYVLEGHDTAGWTVLSRGTTIGYRKLDRFPRKTVQRVRLRVEEATGRVEALRIGLFAGD